ncbi:hypothetical protein BDZ89DRAFT_546736 [Hymenopellis radicata]|nr:hypothetical protein BDZ89DRAFT_407151 [Hymenopellis radicata]KAF9033779.1 hypothetical protein BDZ89DRAFT_546736 [Hymenopellis radicata]
MPVLPGTLSPPVSIRSDCPGVENVPQRQATGQGTRFVLAVTEHLHKRISKLSGRIRQLEDALSSLHAEHSKELQLQDDLIITDEPREDTPPDEPHSTDGIDALGTLTISTTILWATHAVLVVLVDGYIAPRK